MTLQTTLADNSGQVTTGAAVYKALGNRTALEFDSELSTISTNPVQNKAVTEALYTYYPTRQELNDATSIVQETLHDSAWADDITVLASGDYLSDTANKDLTKTPMTVSMDLHFWIPDGSTSDIDASEDIHAIKVPLSGSGTGMRLFLPLSAIASSKRNISTGGSVSLVGMLYLSSGPLTEEDYARGYTYLYPHGFSLSVNDLTSRASLNFGAGSDESEVYFGKSPGPTIPFKTLGSFKVYQKMTDGSCLCVSFASSSWNNVGTPIGVVYMEGAPIKDAVVNNTTAIAAAQAKDTEQDARLDALEEGGGGGGSSAYECWIVLALGGSDITSCDGYKDDFLLSIHSIIGVEIKRMKFSRATTAEELHEYFKTAPLCMGGMYPPYPGDGYIPIAPYIDLEGAEW